jgi:uncharacterized membrane protein YgaE (UPF0421/DUF939 family)
VVYRIVQLSEEALSILRRIHRERNRADAVAELHRQFIGEEVSPRQVALHDARLDTVDLNRDAPEIALQIPAITQQELAVDTE